MTPHGTQQAPRLALNRASQFFDEPNEYRILRLVRDAKVISRTEIARLCRLSKPTVSDIVNRFLANGFLERIGESESTKRGGRKRELLRFNPTAGYVIGVDVHRGETRVAIADLNADIIVSKAFSYKVRSSPEAVLKQTSDAIDVLLSGNRTYLDRCVGIGIGLPGLVDHHSGILKVADTLRGWNGLDLRKFFQKKFGVPVYVDNDVKARTLAEFLFGCGGGSADQVFLWIGAGIGVGIIIDGKLHRGITESAGEIGYNELRFGSAGKQLFPILYNGQRDYGDILSHSEIIERYLARAKHKSDATIESLIDDAERGEKLANRLMDEIGLLVSIICINLINTLNPQLLVIGGKLVEVGSGEALLQRVRRRVREDLLSVPAEAVRLVASQVKEKEGVVLGAVGFVLYDLFKPARQNFELQNISRFNSQH
ncbi:MAG: ROK family transcriptional regulator [Ignavibacteriae bacterium]|nr:ROK family transcriptional regulator [Ignavibacteriota bacterium]